MRCYGLSLLIKSLKFPSISALSNGQPVGVFAVLAILSDSSFLLILTLLHLVSLLKRERQREREGGGGGGDRQTDGRTYGPTDIDGNKETKRWGEREGRGAREGGWAGVYRAE